MVDPTAIVIDDDIDLVSVFCEYLRMLDVDIVGWGYDGKDAVELYRKHKPDIVFLDLSMPQHDGFFAIQGIKNIKPEANVVIVTARPSEKVMDEIQRLGAKIITKPFEADKIIDVIEEVKNQIAYPLPAHKPERKYSKEVHS